MSDKESKKLLTHAEYQAIAAQLNLPCNAFIGGKTEKGCFVLPTIIDGVKAGDKLAQEEVFGPVLAVITVRSTEEAIDVANQTDYGLAASLFSANGKRALRAARDIRAGTVTVNCYGEGDITTPFGGYKQSGFGGRDNSLHAHDQYTELKTIWIDLSDRNQADSID
jgi:gamma-glutamyl-gamma-aminobutyraldehyde dehydrogenase